MKNKSIILLISLIIFLIIFIITGFNNKDNDIKNEVLEYLGEKYNEKFTILDFDKQNSVNDDNEVINGLNKYVLTVESHRLVRFNVIYYKYDNKDYYKNNIDKNIPVSGIYENYIYYYKIKDIKNDILNILKDDIINYDSVDVSLENITMDDTNILVKYSNLDSSYIENIDKYLKLNKRVSNKDYLDIYKELIGNKNIVIDIEYNKEIDKNNIDEFKDEVRNIVNKLKDNGYDYDITFNLNNYTTARVTEYENGKIYLIFDYETYSKIEIDDKLNVYIYR